jgi:hypothetical protein
MSKGRQARKAGNLTAIYEPIVWKMWEPRRLTFLLVSMASYKGSFTNNHVCSADEILFLADKVRNCFVVRRLIAVIRLIVISDNRHSTVLLRIILGLKLSIHSSNLNYQ